MINPEVQTIDSINQRDVETYICDLALLTMTNAEDWNFRLVPVGDPYNGSGKDLICFTHATAGGPRYVPVLHFVRRDVQVESCTDVEIRFEGTIALFRPLTEKAARWMDVQVSEPIYFGNALVVDPRYAKNLARAMKRDGLRLA